MTTVTKRKLICVQPLSSVAKLRFDLEMNGLHSCYVDNQINDNLYLSSVNKKYKFTMKEKNDIHWKIIK